MDGIRDNPGKLSGIERLRAMMCADDTAPLARHLGFRLVRVEEGLAVFESEPDFHSTNLIGSVHGGWSAALLDSACGWAVFSRLSASQGFTTLELKAAFHRPLMPGVSRVRAEGRVISVGRRVGFAEAKLFDEADRLCVSATSTLLIWDL